MLADAVLDDRIAPTAIVTGGSSGVGKAVCETLTRDGFLVAVADRDEVGARAVADACGGVALAVDVADAASVAAMVARAFDALGGRIDALATAAAPSENSRLEDADDEAAFARFHASGVLGTYYCLREAAKRMERGARICTIAPVIGNVVGGLPLGEPSIAARGAIAELTRHAARRLATNGIAVNGVAPEPIAQGNDRAGVHQSIAELVAFLLSPRAKALSGTVLRAEFD